MLSKKFNIPELDHLGLGSPEGIREYIGDTCGIKRTFGFAYHNLNKKHNPNESIQFGNIWRAENHFFRQDIDAYIMHTAISYGAVVRQGARVSKLDITEEKIIVEIENSCKYVSDFTVDASGYKSEIARINSLREEPCRYKHLYVT